MTLIVADPGTEGFIDFGKSKLAVLTRQRQGLRLPTMHRHWQIDANTRVSVRSADSGDWIRIIGGGSLFITDDIVGFFNTTFRVMQRKDFAQIESKNRANTVLGQVEFSILDQDGTDLTRLTAVDAGGGLYTVARGTSKDGKDPTSFLSATGLVLGTSGMNFYLTRYPGQTAVLNFMKTVVPTGFSAGRVYVKDGALVAEAGVSGLLHPLDNAGGVRYDAGERPLFDGTDVCAACSGGYNFNGGTGVYEGEVTGWISGRSGVYSIQTLETAAVFHPGNWNHTLMGARSAISGDGKNIYSVSTSRTNLRADISFPTQARYDGFTHKIYLNGSLIATTSDNTGGGLLGNETGWSSTYIANCPFLYPTNTGKFTLVSFGMPSLEGVSPVSGFLTSIGQSLYVVGDTGTVYTVFAYPGTTVEAPLGVSDDGQTVATMTSDGSYVISLYKLSGTVYAKVATYDALAGGVISPYSVWFNPKNGRVFIHGTGFPSPGRVLKLNADLTLDVEAKNLGTTIFGSTSIHVARNKI